MKFQISAKMRNWIAMFIIHLILTIPFYTTSVYAAINSISAKGGDGVENYARATDFINFNAKAAISGDTVTNDQVVLGSGTQFDKCSPSISNGSECTLRFPGSGIASLEAKSIPYTINLFKDDKTLDDSKSGSITIDNRAPQIAISSQPRFSLQQNVVINYDVTDFACNDATCTDKCVGIKSIEFYTLDGRFKQTVDVSADASVTGCNAKSSISIAPTTFSDGQNSVFAKATDKFNQVSAETSVTFTMDASPPAIVPSSFEIRRKGVSLSAFASNKVAADVIVNISASDLNVNSVKANLSELNPPEIKQWLAASSCTLEDAGKGIYACKWAINFDPKTAGSKTVVINASDTSGNTESASIPKQLSLDSTGPVFQSLSTPFASEAGVIVKPAGNTVIAAFDEATGLSADDVFLSIGGSKIAATSCSKKSSWECTWSNVNFGTSTEMSISADTKDVLGNAVRDISIVDVIIDSKAPVLISINMSPVGGTEQEIPGFFRIGDKIAVEANITEENDVFAVADFSKFISDSGEAAGTCEKIEGNRRTCTWLTSSISLQADDTIKFKFKDNAGNELAINKPLKTYGIDNTAVPDFWKNTVQCSPQTIDRSIGPLVNQRVYCSVSLSPKTSRMASTVFIGQARCSGDDASIVQSVETLNSNAGSTSPLLKITLNKDEFKINEANLKCSFNIFSKVGGTTVITKNPEIENVDIKIGFYNLPLGELGDEVQRQIKQAKEDAKGWLDTIGALNKVVFYSKKICQILGIIYGVIAVWYVFTIGFKETATACTGVTGACALLLEPPATANCVANEATATAADSAKWAGDKFCDFVNCRHVYELPILKNIDKWGREQINSLPGAAYAKKIINKPYNEGGTQRSEGGFADFMDPYKSIIIAGLFACLPAMIYGLDKYRQIQCLYADCLQNSVGKNGLPVSACNDQKGYATCKYVTGEIFALLPWTAVFDHFMGIIKEALSNPFTALMLPVSAYCWYTCPKPDAGVSYSVCRGLRLFSLLGDTLQNIKGLANEGFQIREDYCERLE